LETLGPLLFPRALSQRNPRGLKKIKFQTETLPILADSGHSIAVYGRIGKIWQSVSILGKGSAMADSAGEILTLEKVAAYLKAGKRTVY
jgi:hypothetical protein